MLTVKIEEEFNNQINNELYSSYLYLSMAAYFESTNLQGFAHWMKLQAKEEAMHAMKFFSYTIERNAKVTLKEVKAPKSSWTSPLEVFQDSYDHEAKITKLINNLVQIAQEEKDNASLVFLNWFLQEQVQEESDALKILEQLKMIKDNGGALFVLDKELAQRKEA